MHKIYKLGGEPENKNCKLNKQKYGLDFYETKHTHTHIQTQK